MTIELVPLCSVVGTLRKPLQVGEGPAGNRMVVEVAEMRTTGRLEATMHGVAAADWVTINNGVGTLDVRASLETHDGAIVYVRYEGRMPLTGDNAGTLYVTPTFETGDERYAWLNGIQAIGKGGTEGPELTYEWYEVK